MARATMADVLKRFDLRDVADLLSDTGDSVPIEDIETNENAAACLLDAQGDVDAALLAGNRYTTIELAGLTGRSEAKLHRLEGGRCVFYILSRRPAYRPELLKAFDEWTEKSLELLRKGANVFDLDPQKDAGVVEQAAPTLVDTAKLNLTRDQVKNFYPIRRFPQD